MVQTQRRHVTSWPHSAGMSGLSLQEETAVCAPLALSTAAAAERIGPRSRPLSKLVDREGDGGPTVPPSL